MQVKTRIKLHKHRLPASNSTPKNGQNGNDSQGRLQSHKQTSKNDRKKQHLHAMSSITYKQLEYVDKQQFKAPKTVKWLMNKDMNDIKQYYDPHVSCSSWKMWGQKKKKKKKKKIRGKNEIFGVKMKFLG